MQLVYEQLDELNDVARQVLGPESAPSEPRVVLAKPPLIYPEPRHVPARTERCAWGNHLGCIGAGYISPGRAVRCECDCHA